MKLHGPALVIILAILAWLGAPSAPLLAAHANHANGESGDTADIGMFYDALKPYGAWYNTTQYGDVWHPTVSDEKPDWRPYTNGNWAQTDQGWTWVTDEPFGWAVYHYGRWTQLKDTGWVWVPDSEWAAAWVAWRSTFNLQMAEISGPAELSYHDASSPAATPAQPELSGAAAGEPANPADGSVPASDSSTPSTGAAGSGAQTGGATTVAAENYIGWAPLPPEAALPPDGDIGPAVDTAAAINPDDYCFVNAAEIGVPDLSLVIFPRDQGYLYVGRTVNVTNIAYYGPGGRSVYVGGPDFARVDAVSKQPVRALQLDRQTRSSLVPSSLREGRTSVVRGNTLQIAGPHLSSRPANGILKADRPSFPKADSVKAAPPAGADPATVTKAQSAMTSQAHATVNHTEAERSVTASQAEYREARRSPQSKPDTARMLSAARGGDGHLRSARGTSRSVRSGSVARSSGAQRPQGFMEQRKQRVSQAGRTMTRSNRPANAPRAKKGPVAANHPSAVSTVRKKR